MKRFLRALCAAIVAAGVFFFVGQANSARADANSFAEMKTGSIGHAGAPTSQAAAKRAIKASTATPIETGTSSDPVTRLPGRVTLYNAAEASWNGLVRVRAWYNKRWHVQDFHVSIDPFDTVPFDLTRWDAGYVVDVFSDGDHNGVVNKGDARIKRVRVATSRRWAKRHSWLTRTRDVVLFGEDGTTNPPPASDYASYVAKQGDYGYVSMAYMGPFYGKGSATVVIKLVQLGDQPASPTIASTVTQVIVPPAADDAPSVYINTSGAPMTVPPGHEAGEIGVFLTAPGMQIYSITVDGSEFTFWHKLN